MTKNKWIALFACICFAVSAHAQKYEREARIKAAEMPAPALTYLAKTYPERSRTRHYEEHSRQGKEENLQRFFESKFKMDGYRYSVKFDSLGALYDVERIVAFEQLPSPARQVIEEDLGNTFRHFRIEKIQERYAPSGQLIGYEIEIRGKRNNTVGQFELQYSPDGTRQSLEPIESDPNPFFFF
ncbi:hypothetical protein [Phaeodactylibacter sp.]|uniref:hypothetical protein n=1 Tax=Phaeodactylibacter sp. TaxID=1940289 RepID=UPI0025CB78AE|nr:hypothetical protein [Phaeodactylibacter sp.]MCI4651394.1 hypothetical protein [Phaeodactylibacter sp.]MCI5094397.1 hypothetical protein [Phaeodactylibacter sp.]